jgi:hypothetical protein
VAKTDHGNCPEAIGDHQDGGRGKCSFCGTPMGRVPAPRRVPPTELGQEYRRHYDPDYGTGKDDV